MHEENAVNLLGRNIVNEKVSLILTLTVALN